MTGTPDEKSKRLIIERCPEALTLPECVYIAGSGRNGSTFLGLQLERSPDIFFAGELTHLWERGWKENQLCGCGTAFRECVFWNAVLSEAFPAINENDVNRFIQLRQRVSSLKGLVALGLGQQHVDEVVAKEYGTIHQALIGAISKVSRRPVVIDSSKYPTDLAALLPTQLRLKTIHLVRDCRAVVYSWRRKKQRTEIHWKSQLMPRYGAFQTALAWRQFNSVIEKLTHLYLSGSRLVRYEDLVTDIDRELLKLTGWLGCQPPDIVDGSHVGHSVSGNPCRFQFDHQAVQLDQEWQTQMSTIDRWVTRLLCRKMQNRYGY